MEEVVRGSQEKVGLAQAAYDSVRDNLFSSRSASFFDATNERGVYPSFVSFFRRLTDTYASSTNPSANKKCPSPLGSDKARTRPFYRTSLRPLAGPGRRASRTVRYRASATTRTSPSLRHQGGSAPVAKSPSGWRQGAPTGPPPPPRLPPLPRKVKRERREGRIRWRRRRGLGLPQGSPLPLRAA